MQSLKKIHAWAQMKVPLLSKFQCGKYLVAYVLTETTFELSFALPTR